jgi:hypothetical protein
VADERYSFLVVEATLPTETIAEYRRSRTPLGDRACGESGRSSPPAEAHLTVHDVCPGIERPIPSIGLNGEPER